jgi:hypothetical protein
VAAPGFAETVKQIGLNQEVAALPVAVYPGPFELHTDAELAENTRKVIFPQIVDALTKPIKTAETGTADAPNPGKIVSTGTIDEINTYFSIKKWSDGMPVIPPTIGRVEEFLKFTNLAPDETVATLPSANLRATPWNIAVNGVMAGCRPEYMPILITAVQALGDPSFSMASHGGSTHSFTLFLCVNGPLARQLGIDHGQGLIAHPVNRVIGRALGLIERNIAGFRIKETQMGSFGKTLSWVLAEDEEALVQIGWEPFHVEKGFDRNANTVSAGSSTIWGQNLIPSTSDAKTLMLILAHEISYKEIFASGSIRSARTELMTPTIAKLLANGGYSKKSLKEDLLKNARRFTYEWAFCKVNGSFGRVYPSFEEELGKCLAEPEVEKGRLPVWYPRFSGWEEIETTPSLQADKIDLLICGDPSRNKAQTMAGGKLVTKEIKLPANWDTLMLKKSYRSLNSFYL